MDISLAEDLEKRKTTLAELGVATLPAMWLRPESHPHAGAMASKIGGQIAWPAHVVWPVCDGGTVIHAPAYGRRQGPRVAERATPRNYREVTGAARRIARSL